MKTFVIFVIGIVLLQEVLGQDGAGETKGRRRCLRKNEKFNPCGSACPVTCSNYDNKNSVCTLQCISGCFCENGYIRNSEGDCVLPSECKAIEPQPAKCGSRAKCTCTGDNEVYNECGSSCPNTCDNRKEVLRCPAVCTPGCFCAPGYLRNKWNNCVSIRRCDRIPPK